MRLCLALLVACAAATAQKPNFVFILADDLGWRDLGVYGSTYYETPNIDRLAAEGVRFTDAYAAGNSCSPTRGSILTGKYPATTQLTDWIPGRTPPGAKLSIPQWTNYLRHGETTIAEALAGAGYRSAAIGKWHLGQKGWWPEDQGFQVSVGGSHAGSHGSMFPPYWPAAKMARLGWRTFPEEREGEYLTDRLTREAEAFLEQSAGGPFFLYLSHYAVHTPIQAKPQLVAKYKAKAPSGGQSNPEYAAMVEGLDQSVGAVLAKLDALGLTDNTVVFFFPTTAGSRKAARLPRTSRCAGRRARRGKAACGFR
ncbi:MAG: sulfatase-like hydrolase/transferase [Bryobacterales bacterium]